MVQKSGLEMKGLNGVKREILKNFEISSQNVIQPLPPIEKNTDPEDFPDQYWPSSSKNENAEGQVRKKTFEEKIKEEIDGIVNSKIKDEAQSPRKLDPLPPFNLHISENISVGPGQVSFFLSESNRDSISQSDSDRPCVCVHKEGSSYFLQENTQGRCAKIVESSERREAGLVAKRTLPRNRNPEIRRAPRTPARGTKS